jgi:hypothetical protein
LDKAIITVLLIISGVVCVTVMFNGILPAISRGSDSVASMAAQVDDRIKSQVGIVQAVSEYDPNDVVDHWNDVNANGKFDIFAWVKNVGDSRILGYENCDVFFGTEGNFERIPNATFVTGEPKPYPYWQGTVEDTSIDWGRGQTLKITISYADTFALSGVTTGTTYRVKVILPNGISDEIYLSL